MEGEVLPILRRLLPAVGHIQIADAPGRHQPGSGHLPYPAIFDWLAQQDYAGWIGAEYHPSDPDTSRTLGWLPR